MNTYKAIFIDRKLLNSEYDQLMAKGYLGLKVSLHSNALELFQRQYRVGDEVVFSTSGGKNVATKITSVDIGVPHNDEYKVFIGFAAI